MDRMIASTCFDSKRERLLNGHDEFVPAIDTKNNNNYNHVVFSSVFAKNKNNNVNGGGINGGEGCSKMVVRECRICQEEDEENEMEAPCACNGTLKFAHRKCIQRWCNKKGDITCEICNQVYSPNYIIPPARSNPDVMAIDIRQAWGPQIDFRDGHFLTFAAAERQFLQPEYEDYAAAHSGSIACLRAVAILLMLILLVRQAMLVTRDFGMLPETSSAFFNFQVSLLQLAGLLLPCYVVTRSWLLILRQRRRQG